MTYSDCSAANRLLVEMVALTPQEGPNETAWPGLTAYRFDRPMPPQAAEANSLALCFVAQGRKQFLIGSNEYQCDPSHHMLLTRGLRFTTRVVEASETVPYLSFVLQMDPAVVRSVSAQLVDRTSPSGGVGGAESRPVAHVSTSRSCLQDSVVRFLRSLAEPTDRQVLAPLVLREITYHLLRTEQVLRLLDAAATERHGDPLAEAIAFAREHMARPLTVADMAEHVSLSASVLTNLFVEATGFGPYQFLKRLRLDQAAMLLIQRDLTIAEIAERVGYATPSHFASAFKQFHGLTPRRYAEAQSAAVAMRVDEATDPTRSGAGLGA